MRASNPIFLKILTGIIGMTLLAVGVMVYLLYSGKHMTEKYTPLIDAATEIKLEVTTAHLWLEEILNGDRDVSIEDVFRHLDNADWYAHAMLEGGTNAKGVFQPLSDPQLRRSIHSARGAISQFRQIAEHRYKYFVSSNSGSDIDKRFDRAFEDFLAEADEVKTELQQAIVDKLKKFQLMALLLIVASILSAIFLGYKLIDFERERNHYIKKMESARTRIREQNIRLDHQANHDQLTGLPNRALFVDRLNQAMVHASHANEMVVLLFIDLDKFKTINDTQGHLVGDMLLKLTTERIQECVRKEDSVSRLAGDEFTVILPEIDCREMAVDAANLVASKIIRILAQPFSILGKPINITASIGIAFFPEDGMDSETLLRKADIAMYHAKEEGRNRYKFNTNELNRAAAERYEIEYLLHKALLDDELVIYFHPQWHLKSGDISGFEVLVRWLHPQKGLIQPDVFISVAETTGLIQEIDNWVLNAACAQYAAWMKQGLDPGRIAVNLSTTNFHQRNIFQDIAQAISEHDVPPAAIEIELTETGLMENNKATRLELSRLKDLGIRLAIDDFGTGFSSMAYLRDFPVDTLKIDRSFLAGIGGDHTADVILHNMVSLAKTLKLEVVVEGIENQQQLEFVKELQCDQGQGFKFGKPLDVESATNLLLSKQYTNIHMLQQTS